MDNDIVFKASVDQGGEGGKSLTTLKKEFAEINKELDHAVVGSEKYNAALVKLGKVKNEIGDLRNTINALNPEGKIGAFQNVAGKLAGGFEAATGAAALFGVQSEELEKTLLRVQAATAFAEGIKSIAGMGEAFGVLSTVIKTNVVSAFTTLKGAIIASGIGALAVVIGVLIAKTIEYNETIEEEYDKQKKLNEELKKTTDEYLKQAAASEALRNARHGGVNELERELKLLEASGAKASEIADIKQRIFEKEIENLKIKRFGTQEGSAEEVALTQQILDKEAEKLASVLSFQKQQTDEAAKQAEERKKIHEEELKAKQEADEYYDQISRENDDIMAQAEATAAGEKSRAEQKAREDEAALAQQIFDDDLKRLEADAAANKKARQEKLAEEKSLAQQIAQAKNQIESSSFKAAQNLSNLFFTTKLNAAKGNAQAELEIRKKQFEVEKAFNAVRATIDGFRAVTAALTVPPPFGPVLAGINAAAAAAQVAAILATQFDGGGANYANITAPNTSAPASVSSAPPDAPRVNTVNTTRFNEAGQNLSLHVQADVVETQVTEKQKTIKKIQGQAIFG